MKKIYRRSISGLMALLICFTTILGGGITAFAASSSGEVAKSYSIGFPRSGDANLDYSGTWGHDELHYMNGWTSGEATWMTTLHTIGSFDGPACYCIEPGVPRLLEKTYTRYGEDYWKNYPSDYNSTIDADTIKTLLGRIMQYGYQGDLSLDWRSQNESDADKMAHMMATQVLVWETVVGERDANFNHVDPGSADAVKSMYRTAHPLYSRFSAYYDSIEASVQSHTVIPSFMSKTPNKAQTVELKWDGSQYTATLTDSNHVVSDYTFSSNLSDIVFTSNGDTLTITAKTAPAEPVTISASKNNIRKGVVVWSDGHYGPDGTMQDAVTYAATVMDPVQAFLNLKVSYGSAKIVKTSEDGKVDNLTFTVTGNGINQTVKTNSKGEIQIDNLMPGVYTVTEMDYDKYEPQESRRVTVVSGQISTVTFNNKLKRGDLQIVKSSEDNLNEGVTFHLYGTSLSGIAVDEYAVTDANGVATFEDVLISGSAPYTVEEVDTAVRYVVPEAQSAPINWNEVTNRSFLNILKKFSVTVTKSDVETGTAQGDASLAGAVYGIYKGETLVDTYTTDKNGQFVTKEYICDNDWTVREITPSEGYLLDTTVHKVGAEPQLYTVEHNQTANDVTEQVVKGNIAIIKHTDNGDTQIETPENGAEFAVYLKAAGSYEVAEDTECDYLTCDENGFAQTKDMPYGIYTVHQVSGWEGSEQMPDFDVFISQNGATYRYLINNAPFNSFIKIVKQDAETGKTIPYAGAGFKIYDPDGNPVTMTFTYPTPTTIDVFYTNAEGSLVTPEKLSFGKGYSIVEVQAPYGYVLDETPVYFDVTEDNSTEESGVTVVKVDKPNMAQKGTITVEKTGEVFFGVSVIGGVDESGNELPTIYQPQYEKRGLPGAVYEIIAAEDIITQDGTVRNQKGEVVDTVTTDATGAAVSRELYLGKYEVREITAPHGMALNPEPHCVELVYAGQNVAVTETATSFENERQKVEISLVKSIEQNEHFGIGTNGEMKNISFGLFAAEEIVSASGTSIPANGLVEIISLNEDGTAKVMFEFLDTPRWAYWNIKVHYSKFTSEWNVEGKSYDRGNVKANSTYGTPRINAYRIIEETLNLKDVRIYDYVEDAEGKKKAVLNKKETAIAQAKQELIKQGFQDWVWSDPARREQLCRIYNERFNSIRPREYDGSHIIFSGMNPEIELRKHQRNAVAHILYGGNTLLAHTVGAGKTFEMVAAAMEAKRLGLCTKSLFVVPNHLTEQWAAEFLQLYPSANILVATKKDFEAKNRRRFCGRIATGDYDAIIIGHSQFEKIPMSIERQQMILMQQMDEITEGIADLKRNRGDRFSVKQLEKTKRSLKLKLDISIRRHEWIATLPPTLCSFINNSRRQLSSRIFVIGRRTA